MANMNTLFYQDQYRREFDANVLSCSEDKKGYAVILDQTVFYPEGGGQPADHGTLNDVHVLDVREKDDVIIHYTDRPLAEGSTVHGVIDWDRRFDFMQNHTGEHIVSGIIHQLFGYENVGFHMGETIQVDYSGFLSDEQIEEVERRSNEIIWTNQPVIITYPSEEERAEIPYRSKKELQGTVRIVTVQNADICACCGTHVGSAGEVGLIKIISHEKHKGGIRMELLCGKRAFAYVSMLQKENHEISVRLCVPPEQTSAGVARLDEAMQEKNRQLAEMTALYLQERADRLEITDPLIDVLKGIDRNSMRRYADDLVKVRGCGTAAVLNQTESGIFEYVIITSHDAGLRKLAKELNRRLQGRGGGSDEMIQGTFAAPEEEIRRTLQEMLAVHD